MAKKQRHARRNPVAHAAIMRKGGAHEKSRSSERQQSRQQIRQLLNKVEAGSSGLADHSKSGYCFQHSMCW